MTKYWCHQYAHSSERQNLLKAGRNCVFDTVFFLMCKPPRDLAHRNKKRYLLGGGKGVFLCFCARKKEPVDTLWPCRVGITTLLFLKTQLYFVGNLSNFDKLLKINFALACTYSNGQHDPLPPTAEAAQLIQQRRHTIFTKHRHWSQWDRHSKRQKHKNKRLGATQYVRTKAELQDWKGARTLINTGQKTQRDASASAWATWKEWGGTWE